MFPLADKIDNSRYTAVSENGFLVQVHDPVFLIEDIYLCVNRSLETEKIQNSTTWEYW